MPKNGRRYEPVEVLQNGHADRIPVEAVEMPIDNRALRCFASAADAQAAMAISRNLHANEG
jgi:hypothetical protein